LINLYQALGGGWLENSPQPALLLSPSPRPSGERDGVRGFELEKNASSPQPSPPSEEEREKK